LRKSSPCTAIPLREKINNFKPAVLALFTPPPFGAPWLEPKHRVKFHPKSWTTAPQNLQFHRFCWPFHPNPSSKDILNYFEGGTADDPPPLLRFTQNMNQKSIKISNQTSVQPVSFVLLQDLWVQLSPLGDFPRGKRLPTRGSHLLTPLIAIHSKPMITTQRNSVGRVPIPAATLSINTRALAGCLDVTQNPIPFATVSQRQSETIRDEKRPSMTIRDDKGQSKRTINPNEMQKKTIKDDKKLF
jgi:hypothetical protein